MPAADTDRIQVAQLLTDAAAQGRLDMSEYEGPSQEGLRRPDVRRTGSPQRRATRHRHHGARSRARSIRAVDAAVGDHERLRAARRAERAEAVDVGRLLRRRRDRPALRRLHLGRRGIHSYSICGGQTILVPPEVNVDLRGVGVMGSFDNSSIGAGAQGAPCGHHPRLLTVGQRGREAQEAPGTVRRGAPSRGSSSSGPRLSGSPGRAARPNAVRVRYQNRAASFEYRPISIRTR